MLIKQYITHFYLIEILIFMICIRDDIVSVQKVIFYDQVLNGAFS